MIMTLVFVLAGLVGLFLGGELLVRGAVAIANRLGLSHLFTGLVIVGAATSMPEMVASVEAALMNSSGIAWGNIVGSNIANTLLILGTTALIAPIALHGVGKRDAVVALGLTLLLWLVTYFGLSGRWVGFAFFALMAAYIWWRIKHPPENLSDDEEEDGKEPTLPIAIVLLLGGLGVLVFSGQLLVSGAIELAQMAGVSDAVIGLTVVAVGTSLPELAASIAAALRGKSELAVGNVVGSNIFNILLIGGATMAIAPLPVSPELLDFEFPILAVSALLLLLLCRYAYKITRPLGALLLAGFAGNTALLFV